MSGPDPDPDAIGWDAAGADPDAWPPGMIDDGYDDEPEDVKAWRVAELDRLDDATQPDAAKGTPMDELTQGKLTAWLDPPPPDLWVPTVVELALFAADHEAIWLVSRDSTTGDAGPARSLPISRHRSRAGRLQDLYRAQLDQASAPGVTPWCHGTSDREDADLVVPGVELPGAIVLTNAGIVGGHGWLGPGLPMEYVPERFPWAEAMTPDALRAVRPPLPAGPYAAQSTHRFAPIGHSLRHLAFLVGVKAPDGSWAVEPDAGALAVMDGHWHAHLPGVRAALAGWYSDLQRAQGVG